MADKPTQALTTKNIPTPGTGVVTGNPGGGPVPEAVIFDNSPLVAAPLVGPEFTNVVSKNPNLAFRWILRSDPGKGPDSHIRYSEALAQGFIPATPADCTVPSVAPRDGTFVYGDLVLCKIDRRKYAGAQLHNELLARRRANMNNVAAATRQEIKTPQRYADKIQVDTPTDTDRYMQGRQPVVQQDEVLPLGPKQDIG